MKNQNNRPSSRKPENSREHSDLSIQDIPIYESAVPEYSQLVWAEVNILALPFAVLDEREAKTSSGHEIIKFDKYNEKQVIWLWRVWPDPKVGMPTMSTMRVLFALMELAEEARYPYRLEFSLGEVCKRVGFKVDGRHRAMVRNHIEILASTQCKSKGAFKDKRRTDYLSIRSSTFVKLLLLGKSLKRAETSSKKTLWFLTTRSGSTSKRSTSSKLMLLCCAK